MTHAELITRLSLDTISEMPYSDLASLTDNFAEKDIRAILAKSDDIDIQRRVFSSIKKKYIQWDEARDPFNFNIRGINKGMFGGSPTPDYPKYFDDISLSLKYNFLIEPKKEFSMPYVSPVSLRQRIAGTKTTETPDISKYNTHIIELEAEKKQLQALVKEKDAEIASLKQQLGKCHKMNDDVKEDEKDAAIIEQLKPIFWGDEEQIKSFLEKIRGKKNTAITDVIAEGVKDRIISEQSCHRDLWKILHDAKLYSATESNYNLALNKKL